MHTRVRLSIPMTSQNDTQCLCTTSEGLFAQRARQISSMNADDDVERYEVSKVHVRQGFLNAILTLPDVGPFNVGTPRPRHGHPGRIRFPVTSGHTSARRPWLPVFAFWLGEVRTPRYSDFCRTGPKIVQKCILCKDGTLLDDFWALPEDS